MNKMYDTYCNAIAAYYAGEPIMSDEAFDALEQNLLASGVIKDKVRFEVSNKIETKHLVPALSLAAIHTKSVFSAELYNTVHNIVKTSSCVIQHKYDGMGCEATYAADGTLQKVVTRGNGYVGYDVTAKFVAANKVPIKLAAYDSPYQIRFEAVIKRDTFEKRYHYNEDGSVRYKNERNTAAAFVKSDTMYGMSDVDPIAYMFVAVSEDQPNDFYEYSNALKILSDIDWPDEFIAKTYIANDCDDFISVCNAIANERTLFDYRIDGIVVKPLTDDAFIKQEFANAAEYANMIALKLDAQSAVTKVTKIDWRQKINGELFPRVELEPVDLDGTTVKAASAFNYGFLKQYNIWPGAIVRIEKGGDIIPDIQECLQAGDESLANIPEHAYVDGIHLMLPEEYARGSRFIKGVCKLNIDGLGWTYAERIYKRLIDLQSANIIKLTWPDAPSIADLFELVVNNADKSLFNLLAFDSNNKNDSTVIAGLIDRFNSIHLTHFIECMQVPGIGSKAAYILCAFYSKNIVVFNAARQVNKRAISQFIEDSTLQQLLDKYPSHFVMFDDIYKDESNKQDNATETAHKVKVVMTGSPLPHWKTKKDFIAACEGKLEDVGSNVNDCDYVVTNDVNHMSNKLKAAKAKNKSIITYEQLFATWYTDYKKDDM